MTYLGSYIKSLEDLDSRYKFEDGKRYLLLLDQLSNEFKLQLEENTLIEESIIHKEAKRLECEYQELDSLLRHFLNWKNQLINISKNPEKVKKLQDFAKRFKK